MEVGFVGLGRMGGNMAARLLETRRHRVVVHDRAEEAVERLRRQGATGTGSVAELVAALTQPRRVVWLMLPAGEITEAVFQEVLGLLRPGDVIIEGANSHFRDTVRRHAQAAERGVDMLDVGVSGGIVAAARGYPMMIGGRREVFELCRPLFADLSVEGGFDLVGEAPGAGHYVKMVHNAIEYGMMQAIAEGFDLLRGGSYGDLDLTRIARLWNHGTIISSFLMQMVAQALEREPGLDGLLPHVEDSGEGRWAAAEAIEHAVPFAVNTLALHARFASRRSNSYAMRLLAAMRREFGGHAVQRRAPDA